MRGSDQPELHFAFFADHGLVPCGLPSDADIGGSYTGDEKNFGFGVFGDGGPHPAAGGGQGHGHVDAVGGRSDVGSLLDIHRVNEAEIHDVDGDFRVVDPLQLFPDRSGVGSAAAAVLQVREGQN